MPARRCPHCGLVNPARTMNCDCGYSFVDGSPPRYQPEKLLAGEGFESQLAWKVIIRGGAFLFLVLGVVAIRACG